MNVDEILKLRGWQHLDPEIAKARRKQAAAKAFALDSLADETFGTPAGKKLLRWMAQQTILRPTGDGGASERAAGIREGQNDLVRQLLAMIERAKQGPPT